MPRVVETFLSLQGESTHVGRLCFFIRLAGCNLTCTYCDTMYAHLPESGTEQSLDELLAKAAASGAKLVEITGGEPLLTAETPALCRRLLDAGFEVLIETNGSVSIAALPQEVRKILDCKLPGSGMSSRNLYANYNLLLPHDEVKFVVGSRADFEFAVAVIRQYDLAARTSNLLVSPVWGRVSFEELADWLIESRAPLRMQLQLHKLIWGDRAGV